MTFLNDFLVGIRQLRKNPGSAALAIIAYGVGLGMVGLMLTIIFGVVRGHPKDIDFDKIQTVTWDDSTRHLWTSGAQTAGIRYRDFHELHQEQSVFDSLAAIRDSSFNVLIGNYAEKFAGSLVTADFFRTLTIRPQLGRFFEEGDDAAGAAKMAVLSDHLWRQQFGGDRAIVGRSLVINGVPATVIGVAPPEVDFPSRNDLWVNETIDPLTLSRSQGNPYFVFGQLKAGHTPASALAELNTIAQRFAEAYPDTNTGYIAFDLRPLSEVYLGDTMPRMFYLMFLCSLLVLLIACTNIANLTLSRATTRVKELAIRSSLGGRRSRLVNQMVVEGFSIAIIGGLLGLIIAIWSSKAVWAWVLTSDDANPPVWMSMKVDLQVVATLSVITLLASVVASIVPALKASRTNVNDILKDSSRGSTGLHIGFFSKLLVFFQLCVSCGLLITTSSMVSTARSTAVFEPPYDPEGMMVARFDLPEAYQDQNLTALLRRLQERMQANPALEGVGFTTSIDMLFNWNSRWEVRGRERSDDDDFIWGRHEIVSDNYFDLLGIPILYGRGFDSLDSSENAQQVCVINEPLAKIMWPGESPIGKQLRDVWEDANPWLTVIGVVPDTKMAGPGPRDDEQLGGVYRPLSLAPQHSLSVFAKTSGNPTLQAQAIRAILQEEDPNLALYRVKTVAEAVEDANFGPLFFRNIFGLFGIASLALASIGVYGVMDFSVRQRSQEFGIRQALGANASSVMRHVFRLGMIQVSTGVVLGLGLGWLLVTIIGEAIGGITAGALNYTVPVAVIALIAAIALYLPARYVIRLDLASCLRDE